MEKGLLPKEHLHALLDSETPKMRWNEKEDLSSWQKNAREKLSKLIGLDEIAKYAVKPEIEVEFDKYSEDLDCREIRFRIRTEENVTVPCHLCIPKDANGPLPVMIALQGHSRGMHISLARPKFPGEEALCKGGDRDFVARALKEGICAIAVEQRCFGENGGHPETSAPECRQVAMRAIMLGRTVIGERVWDIMRIIDALPEAFGDIVDPNAVICLGNSGGGTATIYASAIDERIKISVPSCAVCRYADSIGAMLHCECNYIPYIAKDFDMGDLCAMVAPRPLVVVNGVSDTDFPIEGAKACVEVARPAYAACGEAENLTHVIGEGGHRFYADPAWPYIRKALNEL